jgi:hypothetical protein
VVSDLHSHVLCSDNNFILVALTLVSGKWATLLSGSAVHPFRLDGRFKCTKTFSIEFQNPQRNNGEETALKSKVVQVWRIFD